MKKDEKKPGSHWNQLKMQVIIWLYCCLWPFGSTVLICECYLMLLLVTSLYSSGKTIWHSCKERKVQKVMHMMWNIRQGSREHHKTKCGLTGAVRRSSFNYNSQHWDRNRIIAGITEEWCIGIIITFPFAIKSFAFFLRVAYFHCASEPSSWVFRVGSICK